MAVDDPRVVGLRALVDNGLESPGKPVVEGEDAGGTPVALGGVMEKTGKAVRPSPAWSEPTGRIRERASASRSLREGGAIVHGARALDALRGNAHAVAFACAFAAVIVPQAVGAVPGEVTGVAWCGGSKDCLVWTAVEGADAYDLHRGPAATLAALATADPDSCLEASYVATTTGGALPGAPTTGSMYWYLVTARNAEGSGTAGDGASGPRSLDSTGPCGRLVINEVDYDQPGTDAQEFVELLNPSGAPFDLSSLTLIFVNGSNGQEYRRIPLGGTLSPGGYLVVASNDVVVDPGAAVIRFPLAADSIQNGAPDGIALFDLAGQLLLDALSYEGSLTAATFTGVPGTWSLVEGQAALAADSAVAPGSLSRVPNGADTNDAASDWSFVTLPTPGRSN
jgi:hypothetical protein